MCVVSIYRKERKINIRLWRTIAVKLIHAVVWLETKTKHTFLWPAVSIETVVLYNKALVIRRNRAPYYEARCTFYDHDTFACITMYALRLKSRRHLLQVSCFVLLVSVCVGVVIRLSACVRCFAIFLQFLFGLKCLWWRRSWQ